MELYPQNLQFADPCPVCSRGDLKRVAQDKEWQVGQD